MVRSLAAALLALALLVPAAHARTVTGKSVVTADGKSSCFAVVPAAGTGIGCSSQYLPDTGELDPYLSLGNHGRAEVGERGDYPGYTVRPVKIRPGDRWVYKSVTCVLDATRLKCTNLDHHGFRLRASGVKVF